MAPFAKPTALVHTWPSWPGWASQSVNLYEKKLARLGRCPYDHKRVTWLAVSPFKVSTTEGKQISRTFQGFFKDKLSFQALRFIQEIGILQPLVNTLLAKTRHKVIYDFYFFSHSWSHYHILLSRATLWKMIGYDLQLYLRYINSMEACVTDCITPRTQGLEARGSNLALDRIVSLDKEFYFTLSRFTQMYKWVLARYCWGLTLRWTRILSRGE